MRNSALVGTLCVTLMAGHAFAQDATYTFDIPSEPLAQALHDLARISGKQIIFTPDQVSGKTAPALQGKYTASEALSHLFAGTGLVVDQSSSAGLMVQSKNVQAAQNDGAASTASSQFATTVETVLVTADKKVESLQDVPTAVTVVNTQNLAANNQTLLRDYYSTIPGLTYQSGVVSGQNYTIRGISSGSNGNPLVGIVVDDVPVDGTLAPTGGSFVPDFDPGDLDHIEVLRGPQGTLYGADSMGGLIKFVTKDPSTDGFTARLQGGYSSVYNGNQTGYELRGSFNIPLSDTLAATVSGFERQIPGYINNPTVGQTGVNEGQSDGARLSLLWKPNSNFSAKFGVFYQHDVYGAANDQVVAPGLKSYEQNYVLGGFDAYQRERTNVAATLKYSFDDIDLTSVSAYTRDGEYSNLDFGFAFGQAIDAAYQGNYGAVYDSKFTLNKYSQELRAAGSAFQNLDWTVGLFYTYEDAPFGPVTTTEPTSLTTGQIAVPLPGYSFGQFKASYREFAPFADVTYHLTSKLSLDVGGRFSQGSATETTYGTGLQYNSPNVAIVSPQQSFKYDIITYSAAPKYEIDPDWTVYGRVSSGFRPGGLGNPTNNIPSSRPDKVVNYELGSKSSLFDNRLTLDISVYHIEWQAIQTTLNNGTYSYAANAGAAKSDGAEIEASLVPFEGTRISGWVAYDNAVLTDAFPASANILSQPGDKLPMAPTWSAHISIDQDFPVRDNLTAYVGGELSYIDDRLGQFADGPRQFYPNYTQANLHGGIRFGNYTLNAYINNVANTGGLIGGGQGYLPANAFVYITPRTMGVNLIDQF